MSLFINTNNGPIYNDCTVTINNGQTTVEQERHASSAGEPQDVPFEEESCIFPLLTEQCRKENRVPAVEAELRAACKGTAVELWKTIRTNEALGYISADSLQTAKIYRAFTDYFGELPYTERNFRDARAKS